MRSHLAFPLAGALCSVLCVSPALAGPFDEFGAGDRGSALAGAQTARPHKAAAVHHNVGALAFQTRGLTLGTIAAFYNTEILLHERPPGYDVPELGDASPSIPTSRTPRGRRDTVGSAPMYAIIAGGVTSLGFKNVRFGALAFLPADQIVALDTHFVDERERFSSNRLYYELLDKRLRRIDLQLGASWRLRDWLGVGLGVMTVPGATLANDVYLQDPTNQSDVDINLTTRTDSTWGWTTGVALDFAPWLTVGLSYHSELAVRLTGSNRVYVLGAEGEDGGYVTQRFDMTPAFTPGAGALGVASTLGDWTLHLDGRWTRWSQYRNTHSELAGFHDTLSWRFGASWVVSEEMTARAGLRWTPSPVPEQTGRTNYVDNDRLIATLGTSHRLNLFGEQVELDWFAQLHALRTRHTMKERRDTYPVCTSGEVALCDEVPDTTADPRTGIPYEEAQGLQTGNPGFPGFSSGGWIGAVGFTMTFAQKPAPRRAPTNAQPANKKPGGANAAPAGGTGKAGGAR